MTRTDYVALAGFAAVALLLGIGNLIVNGAGFAAVAATVVGTVVAVAIVLLWWRSRQLRRRGR